MTLMRSSLSDFFSAVYGSTLIPVATSSMKASMFYTSLTVLLKRKEVKQLIQSVIVF
jgi:hypothetical protein